ncbi:MAG: sigma-70 family RNA polymerase sigma factor, partial [Planctomycetota bacterium]
MTTPPASPDLDALLAHHGWVRALARSLVADPVAAEDVAQEAWQVALERPPQHAGNLRAWWASVVRSSAGKGWREQKRRRALEEGIEAREAAKTVPTPDDLAARMDTFRRLAAAVAQLPEPYGSAIYLRFFEELPVREVARRQEVPLATAQSRITRGVARLREALEQDLGPSWRQRCLVFTVPLKAAPLLPLGPLALLTMNTKTTLGLAAGLLALLTLFLWSPWEGDADAGDSGLAAATPPVMEERDPEEAALVAAPPRDPELRREEIAAAEAAAPEESFVVLLRDATTLEPLGGGQVHVLPHGALQDPEASRWLREERPDRYRMVAELGEAYPVDELGRAFVPRDEDTLNLVGEAGDRFGYDWLSPDRLTESGVVEMLLQPRLAFTVEVRDAAGPAAGVMVGLDLGSGRSSGFPQMQSATDAAGRAAFDHAELVLDADRARLNTVAVMVAGPESLTREVATADLAGAVLRFELPARGTLEVAAFDEGGQPLADGTPLMLQRADRDARRAAEEREGTGPTPVRFRGRLATGVMTAYVREGVAVFEGVAFGSELAWATYDRRKPGYEVAVGPGLDAANPRRRVELHLDPSAGEIPVVLLHGPDGERRSGTSVVTADWEIPGARENARAMWLRFDEEGKALFPLPRGHAEASRLEMTWNQSMELDGTSPLAIGFLILTAPTLQRTATLEMPVGTSRLLEATMLDDAGLPYPHCPLRLRLDRVEADGSKTMIDAWDFNADAAGGVVVDGPMPSGDLRLALGTRFEDGVGRVVATALPFTPGDRGLRFTVSPPLPYAGRVLVDDPSLLPLLVLRHVRGVPGEAGSWMRHEEMERPNGRYRFLPMDPGPHALALEAKGTGEPLAVLLDLGAKATTVDGERRLADWDLRGKLHRHELVVIGPAGEATEGMQLRLPGEDLWRDFTGGAFLSQERVLQVDLRAAGMRETRVVVQGRTEVRMEQGLRLDLRLAAVLPAGDDLAWEIFLLPTGADGSIMISGRAPEAVRLDAAGEATLVLPRAGAWALGLRARREGTTPGTFQGVARFAGESPFHLVEVDEGMA